MNASFGEDCLSSERCFKEGDLPRETLPDVLREFQILLSWCCIWRVNPHSGTSGTERCRDRASPKISPACNLYKSNACIVL